MERCPNCGAPARPGAKFCTTCGYRLPASPAAGQQEGATESVAPASTSTWPAAAAEAPSTAPSEATAPDDTAVESTEIEEEDQLSVATEPAPVEAGEADSGDQVLSSAWPAPSSDSWSAGWEKATTGDGDGDARPASADDMSADDQGAEPSWPPPSEAAVAVEEVASEAAPAEAPMAFDHTVTPTPEAGAAPAGASAAEPTAVARANDLLDELRSLLPSLAGTAPTANLAAIADELEAAITPLAGEDALDLQALREAMTTARDRPRDIDTVLDLSRRIDAVLDLIDAHDRGVVAIERAVAALRAESVQPEASGPAS